jgi:uncharacterized SAM-binding protein YcdF (DUF218 family)
MTELVMPVGFTWLASLFIAVWGRTSGQRIVFQLFLSLFVAITLAGSTFVARWLLQPLEWPRKLDEYAVTTPYRTIVVLGGGITIAADGLPELNSDGQRIFSVAQLWHRGKTQSIICTGSSSEDYPDPSVLGRQLLESVGVPSHVIYEVKGQNTSQEMEGLERFFASLPSDFPREGRLGLVTSAFHMPRALRLARTRNLQFVPLPCSYRVGLDNSFSFAELIPSNGSLTLVGVALKEKLARLFGR